LPLSVIFFNWMANRGRPIRATEKMIAGFVLTALSMVIMSTAGFMAGAKQDAVKLTTPQGVLILDNSQGPLADVKKSGSSVLACGGGRVSSADFEYDAEKKKLSFTNGKIILADGHEVPVKDGHLAVSAAPDATGLTTGGVLEPLLKTGDDLK